MPITGGARGTGDDRRILADGFLDPYRREPRESGIGFAHEDVAEWLRAKVAGKKQKRLKPVWWRK
ncbi:MAG: hypothetical protein IPP91_15595 [Betaproteobacteria bacterium]|nr:hypothetical protein [Betaproteobacteria bacterium]